MKTKQRILFPILAGAVVAAAAVSILPSCGQPADSGGTTKLDATQRSEHFEAVSAHLDLGGEIYAYVDVDGDAKKIASIIDEFIGQIGKASGEEMPTVLSSLDMEEVVADMGLSGIAALGMSSYKNGDLYRNNYYLHVPEGREGLLKMAGGESSPFSVRKLAPAGSDLVVEQDLDLKSAFALAETLARKIGGPKAAQQFREATSQPMEGMGITAADIFSHLDTKLIMIGELDSENPMDLPQEVPLKIPGVELLIAIDGIGPIFAKIVDSIPANQRQGLIKEGDGFQDLVAPVPPEISKFMQPLIRHETGSGRILIATSPKYLEKCLSAGSTVWDDEGFQTAMDGLPDEGNGLSFVSAKFVNEYLRIYGDLMKAMGSQGQMPAGFGEMIVGLMQELGLKPDHSQARVIVNLPEGILVSENSGASAKQSIVAAGVGMVAGFAGMTAPMAYQQQRAMTEEALDKARAIEEIEREASRKRPVDDSRSTVPPPEHGNLLPRPDESPE